MARVLQVMALVAIALIPVLEYAVLIRPVTFLILVSVIFMIALGVDQPAGGFATGAFLRHRLGRLPRRLRSSSCSRTSALVPHTFMTQHSWQVGALLEMILLSMTLSQPHERAQAPEPHRSAHAARQPPRCSTTMLPVEFARAREQDSPLSLLVLDIDQFKLYNDLHGHAQGDEAVKAGGAGAAQARAQARTSPVVTAATSSASSCPAPTKHRPRCSPSDCAPPCRAA